MQVWEFIVCFDRCVVECMCVRWSHRQKRWHQRWMSPWGTTIAILVCRPLYTVQCTPQDVRLSPPSPSLCADQCTPRDARLAKLYNFRCKNMATLWRERPVYTSKCKLGSRLLPSSHTLHCSQCAQCSSTLSVHINQRDGEYYRHTHLTLCKILPMAHIACSTYCSTYCL